MKKRLLFSVVFLSVALFSMAQVRIPLKGYRGFVDLGGSIIPNSVGGRESSKNDGAVSVSTIHGYQFNRYFYLGAGIGLDSYLENLIYVPFFIDFRTDFIDFQTGNLNKPITPFFDLRFGYSNGTYASGSGLYTSPSIGLNFSVSRFFAVYFKSGYVLQSTYYGNLNGIVFNVGLDI